MINDLTLPLRVRNITEGREKGVTVWEYRLTPSIHQSRLSRASAESDLQAVTPQEFVFQSTQRLAGVGVGDYFTWDLVPFTPLQAPKAGPGSGLMGLIAEVMTRLGKEEDEVMGIADEPDEDVQGFTRRYITQNYNPDEWQRMDSIQRGEALGKARLAYADSHTHPVAPPESEDMHPENGDGAAVESLRIVNDGPIYIKPTFDSELSDQARARMMANHPSNLKRPIRG